MQTLFISTPTFDLNGSLALRLADGSDIKSGARRVSRNATLDGGAVITDGGYSDADRTLVIRYSEMTEADEIKLRDIFQTSWTL